MRRPRTFHPELTPGSLTLDAAESHHLRDVLRCRNGEQVALFDGQGHEAAARVASITRRAVCVDVQEVLSRQYELAVRLTLAVAMPRAARQAFLFEKCTELGVWAIWPTLYEHTVVRPKAPQVDKWRRTAIEACKQSGRAWLPHIQEPACFDATLPRAGDFDLAIVTDADPRWPLLPDVVHDWRAAATDLRAAHGSSGAVGATVEPDSLERRCGLPETVLVWVGPEGGLTRGELDAARAAGAVGARLGPGVLRVETAAVAVAGVLSMLPTRAPANQEPR